MIYLTGVNYSLLHVHIIVPDSIIVIPDSTPHHALIKVLFVPVQNLLHEAFAQLPDSLAYTSLLYLQRRRERFVLPHTWNILHFHKNKRRPQHPGFLSAKTFNLSFIPSKSRYSSAANQTLFGQSFAVLGPISWNAMVQWCTI